MVIWKTVKLMIVLFLAVMAFLAGWAGYYLVYPDVDALKTHNPGKTAFMATREIEWAKKRKKLKIIQKWTPLAQISPFLIEAVLIGEDDKFWHHEGFDMEGLQLALEKDMKMKKVSAGGSTITQQLAKNLYLSPEKSLVRKVREAIITWRLEKALSKKRILEIYLNVAEWGEGIFGAEAASQYHYGKPAFELSPVEAAHLAAVLPNPRYFDPTGNSRYVTNRFHVIYDRMAKRDGAVGAYEDLMQSPEPPE